MGFLNTGKNSCGKVSVRFQRVHNHREVGSLGASSRSARGSNRSVAASRFSLSIIQISTRRDRAFYRQCLVFSARLPSLVSARFKSRSTRHTYPHLEGGGFFSGARARSINYLRISFKVSRTSCTRKRSLRTSRQRHP